MRASVTLRTADGREHELGHGDIIGRLWSAALLLSSPDISEAHALVSLRAGRLHLLSLRGIFALGGRPRKELVLEVGQHIAFSRDISLEVVAVRLPDHALGLEGDGLVRQPLVGVSSLWLRPRPKLAPGVDRDADAVFFDVDDVWQVRTAAGDAPLEPGWRIDHPGGTVQAVRIPLSKAGQRPTEALGRLDPPLVIEAHFDTAYLHRGGLPAITLSGHAARILSELGAAGTTMPWPALAGQLWQDEVDRDQLRHRLDVVLARLRRKLRREGVRPDLVSSDGSGNIGLVLRPGDRFDDRS